MDERKLTIIRGDKPDDPGRYLVTQLFLFMHKYWLRKVHKLVIFVIQYIVGGFSK